MAGSVARDQHVGDLVALEGQCIHSLRIRNCRLALDSLLLSMDFTVKLL